MTHKLTSKSGQSTAVYKDEASSYQQSAQRRCIMGRQKLDRSLGNKNDGFSEAPAPHPSQFPFSTYVQGHFYTQPRHTVCVYVYTHIYVRYFNGIVVCMPNSGIGVHTQELLHSWVQTERFLHHSLSSYCYKFSPSHYALRSHSRFLYSF